MKTKTKAHPLQNWMPKGDFAIVEHFVDCEIDTDISTLSTENHVEVCLNTEITFQETKRDVRRRQWFPEQSCKYNFHFRGVNSGTSIKFSTKPTCPNWKGVRDTLMSSLAAQCKAIKRLSIHGYAIKSDESCGFMGSFDIFDGPDRVFSSWADTDAVLMAFAKAGHWKDSLQQLDIMNHASSMSTSALQFLPSWPLHLRVMQVAHFPWETDRRITNMLRFFPALEKLQITCSNQFGMHYPFFGFQLWKFLKCLQQSNSNIRSLGVVWNAVASVSAGRTDEHIKCCLQGLKSLRRLEHLTIGPNVWDGTRDTKALAHGILRLLPDTRIKELRLQTIPVAKECLYEQLSREDCQLDFLDVTPYGIYRRCDIPLATLTKFAKTIHIPVLGDSATLDFVFLLRRFRRVLSLDANRAAALWPLLLSAVGHWKMGKGVSMPLNRRREPTHWLTDKGIRPPSGRDKNHANLKRSLFFSLLRERADIVCAGLHSQRAPENKSKRMAGGEFSSCRKRNKIAPFHLEASLS